MKIDIHCHTSKYSPCSEQTPEEMIERAIRREMKGIIITEHQTLWKKEELFTLQEKFPDILILNGVELTVSSDYNTYDVLVYGLAQGYEIPKKMLTVEEIFELFEKECAFVLAHPFRFSRFMSISDNTLGKFHGIEIDSSNFKASTSEMAVKLSERLNIPGTTASDSHSTKTTGLWYIEIPEISSMEEFVQVLKKKQWKTKKTPLETEEGTEKSIEHMKKIKEESRMKKLQKAEKILQKCHESHSKKAWWKFWE
ncbi:MAG: PHP domain-containing protein [Candidatus Eremiobacterota bacterium]